MKQIRIQPKARRDLLDIYSNLGETLGLPKAEQFEANAFLTFIDLANMPNMGAPRVSERNPHRELRMWRVRDFEEYLIFYSVVPDAIRIGRVIHAKRDYRRKV